LLYFDIYIHLKMVHFGRNTIPENFLIYIQKTLFFVIGGVLLCKGKGKVEAIPLELWTGPGGSRRLRLPYFKTIST